jgi:hypothetical protein
MRALALALLAGLLAVTAAPVQALCAVDAEGGCSRLRHSLDLEVSETCPDAQPLCIVDKDGNLSQAPNDADYDIVVRNPTGSAITFEVFVLGGFDDDGMPTKDRVAPQRLASMEIAAGQTATLEDILVPGNVSYLRVQAMSAAGTQAEQDAELLNYRIMMMQPGDGLAEDGSGEEPAGNLDDEVPEDAVEESGKDAPAAPFALVVAALACLALAVGLRRDE